MSQLIDYVLKPDTASSDLDMTSFLTEDINNMDIPLNLENPELMSSDFFDSVLSMEKQNDMDLENSDMKTDSDFSCNTFSPVYNGMSEHSSFSSDSDHFLTKPNTTLFGTESSEPFTDNEFFSLLEQHNIQTNLNDLLDIASKPEKPKVRQISTPKKVIVSKPIVTQGVKKGLQPGKKQQVIRVQAINGNGRSLLLPVNVKSVKKLKIINPKEIDMESIKMFSTTKNITKKTPHYAASAGSESDFEVDSENYTNEHTYPPLQLSVEEKRLLMKEGIKLPSHYPLTKNEEKELKRIRRKIRNKISAQDSRKRKKEYVDQLEEKARRTDEENEILKKRVKLLNKENTRLYEQLKKLQDLLFNSSNKATPATCLMIVLFSTLLVFLPNLRTANNKDLEVGEQLQLSTARRALLYNKPSKEDDELDEFLIFKDDVEMNFDDEEKDNGTNAFVKYLGDLSEKYEGLIKSNCTEILQGGSMQEFCKRHEEDFKVALQNLRAIMAGKEEKKFIEPDISDDEDSGGPRILPTSKHHNAYLLDDDDPPTKKMKGSSDEMEEYDKDPLFHSKHLEITGDANLFPMQKE